MRTGLMAGILWGLDTVILGIALSMSQFVSTKEAVILAPFVSTFLHDFCSSAWMLIYMGAKKQLRNVVKAFRTKSGKFIVLGALLGGPIGMSGYVAAINYIGPAYTAIISAMFPAMGALLSYIFLKERMKPTQLIGLFVSIGGVIMLGYSPGSGGGSNMLLGFICAIVCVIGWSSEAVICAYGMKDPDVSDEQALQIRQMTSAVFYGIIILPVISGWGFTLSTIPTKAAGIILISALFGTSSYLCYYRAICKIGPPRAMALNITYSAWAIIFSLVFLGAVPSVKDIICGIIVIGGSLVAAADIKQLFGKRKRLPAD